MTLVGGPPTLLSTNATPEEVLDDLEPVFDLTQPALLRSPSPVNDASQQVHREEQRSVAASPEPLETGVSLSLLFSESHSWREGITLVASIIGVLPGRHESMGGPGSVTANSVFVSASGKTRSLHSVADTSENIQTLTEWIYRSATGRFPKPAEPLSPSQVNADVPTWVDEICARGLTPEPQLRYRHLDDLQLDLVDHSRLFTDVDLGAWSQRVRRAKLLDEDQLARELSNALFRLTKPPRTQGLWRSFIGLFARRHRAY